MFRSAFILLAAGGFASSASAGFTVTHTQTSVDSVLDRIDIYAQNTGGDTGTGLIAVEMSAQVTNGVSVWRSTSAGNWNPLNSADTSRRSQVRVDPEDVSSSSLISKTPSANQPLAPQYGASTVALGNFGVVVAGLAGAVPPQSAQGNLFASLYVSKGYAATISGNVGGSAGSKVGFSFITAHGDPFVVVNSVPDTQVVFGQVVTNGAPFSVNVQAFGGLGPLSLFTGVTNGISNIAITPSSALSPATFTVTGVVDYRMNGSTINVPVIVSDGTFTGNGSFRLIVTPEPASLSLVGACAFVRRKR